ncbi:putative reverse transcriptase domain-containing protein [Tanacetum coccineum]
MQRGKVITYASWQLKSHEKKYTTHDLEMGEVVFALKTWRHYLYRTKSVIYMERKSLQHIFDQKELNICQIRCIVLFSDYDYEIRHHLGKVPLVGSVRTLVMDKAHASRLPRSSSGYDTNWVIVDRLTKSAYFMAIREDYKMEKLARLYIDEIVAGHGVPVSIISDRDGRFTSSWDTHLPLAEFSYNNSYHLSIRCALFEALYGRMCRSLVLWAEIRESVVRFGTKGKLAPIYVGPFEILERIGPVAYRLRLPQELSGVHYTFHVSNLKKCLADANLNAPLGEVKIDKTLRFVEEPVDIMDREVKKLKRSRIPIVKVCWNSKRGPEFTWEREDFIKAKYLNLFVDRVDESTS